MFPAAIERQGNQAVRKVDTGTGEWDLARVRAAGAVSISLTFEFPLPGAGWTVLFVVLLCARTGEVVTLAGQSTYGFVNGVGTNAQFYNPYGGAVSFDGSLLYVADGVSESAVPSPLHVAVALFFSFAT